MAFINKRIVRKNCFIWTWKLVMPQNYHLAESRLVDFLFFLLKKKNSAWQSSSYTESARKIMLTICLLGSVTLIDTITKSLNHFVGKWKGENYKQIKVGRELRTLTHVLAVRKTWKLSLKDMTGWSAILLTNLLSAICRDFKNSGANRSKCFVNECFSGSGWKDNKSQ